MKVRVTRKSHGRHEGRSKDKRGRMVLYRVGDEFDATDREYEQFSDRLEKVTSKPGRPKKAAPALNEDADGSEAASE